ncbi:sterol desaturase family protein [Geomesophilobacter sediminis]|uniref:Sterol desaturase family protein n=1 Tax=Geomesophilobacter sediminis TaxID=2798584 RepID=A0A8J7JFE5_9BACT|nr:sterol desaturase family protein [Geomesophilobacter sediminis]MBJ6725004.1 sterol desaturase family protein [Geomesophilobacter sediminis]
MQGKPGRLNRQLPGWFNNILIFGTMAAVVAMELKRPLRRARQDKLLRDLRNMTMAATSAATVALLEKPVTTRLTALVQQKRWGLLKLVRLPFAVELFLSVVLLDYTLYLWHVLTHRVPFLWRFHQPHHVDLDMDATTALRFHFGEIALSVPWRGTQVLVLGISPLGLGLWQTLTLMAIMFHHSDQRLPLRLERWLSRLITTPRMHGIHHSIVRDETDSNWSTIFSWPDYLHRTIRLNVPQDQVTIGVPAYQDPAQLTIGKILMLPFEPQGPAWQLDRKAAAYIPATESMYLDAGEPKRDPQPGPVTELAP